jgi:DNA polymerase-1
VTVEETEKSGKVSTLFGRERKIPGINSRNKTERMAAQRVAVNTPIQGSAADIVKVAMLKISDRIKREGIDARLVLQVHDELVFEVADGQVGSFKEVLREEMENAVTLDVPLRVGIEAGACWGEFH